MPIQTVPGPGLDYRLARVDGAGEERNDDPDGGDGRLLARIPAGARSAASPTSSERASGESIVERIGDGIIVPGRELAKALIQRNHADGYALFGEAAAWLRLEVA